MANKFNPNLPVYRDKAFAKKIVEAEGELERIKAERGWLGNIWGSSSNVPNNMAALTIVVSFLAGTIYSIAVSDKEADKVALSIKDFWSILSPLITLSIGYLFGDKKNKPEKNSD